MKALVREIGETVLETDNIPGIDWNTGYPLIDAGWSGGPYRLVQNYVAPVEEGQEEVYEEIVTEPVVEENEDDYVIINGVRYSKDELRSLIE